MGHTPGPWKRRNQETEIDAGRIGSKTFRHIAILSYAGLLPDDETRANAALIAAAPRMFNALEDIELAWGKAYKGDDPISGADMVDWFSSWFQRHGNVIAKAKGEA